jgi:ATP-binding cassette subfamily B protein
MIYKDAPVHILDDSLSAVDTKTERHILTNLRNRNFSGKTRDRKTTIIISHRLSAVMNADEILVLDKGHVLERGTHSSLLKIGGLYSRLWNMQSGASNTRESFGADDNEKANILEAVLDEDAESIKAKTTEEGV